VNQPVREEIKIVRAADYRIGSRQGPEGKSGTLVLREVFVLWEIGFGSEKIT
jgi:hypothetical protein